MTKTTPLKLAGGLLVALAAVSTQSAYATPVTVSGITWDPAAAIDFTAQTSLFVNDLTVVGDVASGIGQVFAINGVGIGGTNELTYVFGGYEITSVTGNDVTFDGGWVNFYSDASNDFTYTDVNTADNGTLWLALEAHQIGLNSLIGRLTSLNVDGNAQGALDVVGGTALQYFDTNAQIDGSDFEFISSWNIFPNGRVPTSDGLAYAGGATLTGRSAEVSEPQTLAMALLGIGLIGFSRMKSYAIKK